MSDPDLAKLILTLDEALEMLAEHRDPAGPGLPADPLPSLLQQCEALCAETLAQDRPVAVRSLHHFACTGGTLLAKCVAALPGAVLLSEIDPLSTLHLGQARKLFFPTDILADLHIGLRPAPPEDIADVFMAGILRLRDRLALRGQTLVIRDHAHSQFCTKADMAARASLLSILRAGAPVRPLVTLRHPLDSFLALQANAWMHFSPPTLDEYCRRYLAFLAAHEGVPRMLYEDFVADPEAGLARICDHLDMAFDPVALDLIGALRLSGDSGRSGARIGPRPRRAVPEAVAQQARSAQNYDALCAAIGYDPDPGAPCPDP